MGQKRKRLALSCVDCRRRKVKCDRTYPVCIRCQKGNNGENCSYVSHTGLEPGLPTPSDDSPQHHHGPPSQIAASGEPYVLEALREMSPHMEVQSRQPPPLAATQGTAIQHRPPQYTDGNTMRSLYEKSSFTESNNRTTSSRLFPLTGIVDPQEAIIPGLDSKQNPAWDFSKVLVRGKDCSTHYYGPSFAISMLLQFEELSRFVKGMLNQAPSLAGVKEKMASTRKAEKEAKKHPTKKGEDDFVSMVPDRALADKLVAQYLDTFENTYRVLHVPTFQRSYEAYWNDPSAANPDFVVRLLLVMASVYPIVPGGPKGYVGRYSACRDVASGWIKACESWLEEQSKKHVTLAHFQAHVLVYIAKVMNNIKIKRYWTSSGQLLRSAMAVGMHREPSLLSKKIDVFVQEMRRRLWYTIVELDLQSTISRGMPPTIDSFGWDCQPPHNIDDEDFDEDTVHLPPSKSRSVFTRTSFLNIATESLPLRVEILGRINSVRLGIDVDAVMTYDTKIRGLLDGMPTWSGTGSAEFAHRCSLLVMYEYLLIMHVPFASQAQSRARAFYSVASKRDISFKTLQIYANMPDQDRLILIDFRDDYCRAALALAHDITTSMKNDIMPSHEEALAYIESVVETAAVRFSRLGQGFHTFWITLSTYNLLRWKTSQSPSAEPFSRAAGDRVSELFQQIISNQVPIPLPNGDMPAVAEIPSNTTASVPTDVVPPSLSEQPPEPPDGAFAGFDQINFFDDPFSDINFDLASVWGLDGFGET